MSSKISNIDRKMLEPTKKETSYTKTKKKLHARRRTLHRRGTLTIKSNPHTHWVGDPQSENNNTKEGLPLLWQF